MKISHINLSNTAGGAANALVRLYKCLAEQNIESVIFVGRISGSVPENIVVPPYLDLHIFSKLRYLITRFKSRKSTPARGLFSADWGSCPTIKPSNLSQFDAIYLHWINHGMMSMKMLEKILKLKLPVFWVCHDMWPLTGGCHHSFECDKYKCHCADCPSLTSKKEKDISYRLFEKKLAIFQKYENLNFIAISPFMQDVIKNSKLSEGRNVFLIPNPIDLDIFKPLDRNECRAFFSLPQHKKLILFGADMGTRNPYKGWQYAKESIQRLYDELGDNFELVVFGSSGKNEEHLLPIKINYIGTIKEPETMAMLYSAVDVYLNPSIAESLSYTTMESIACGVPCTAFDVGGIPSIIEHKVNGFLAKVGDIEAVVDGIKWSIEQSSNILTREKYHNTIKGKFDNKTIGEKHLSLLKKFHCDI